MVALAFARRLLPMLRAEEKVSAEGRFQTKGVGVAVARSLDAGGASGSSAAASGEHDCVVCLDEQKSVLIMPCRHLCLCEACAVQVMSAPLVRCPVCRGKVASIIATYI